MKFIAEEQSLLKDISQALSPLERAEALQSLASEHGFDWPEIEPVFRKIEEELAELKAELKTANEMKAVEGSVESQQQRARIEDEFGDVLFCCVNLARFIKVKPDRALASTNEKFIRRFQFIEKCLFESEQSFESATLEQLDEAWDRAKLQGL